MSQLDEAVIKYNKLLESGVHRDLGWAEELHAQMEEAGLSAGGRLVCPFLRPSFISRRQYESLVKTGESLIAAIDRMEQMVLAGRRRCWRAWNCCRRRKCWPPSIPAIRASKWRRGWIRTW